MIFAMNSASAARAPVDQGAAAELPHAQLVAQDRDLDPELIAGSDRPAERAPSMP